MSSSSLTCGKLASWTIAAILLQILGLSLFVIGFFPVKPTLPGFSGPESYRAPTCDPVPDAEERDLPSEKLRTLYKELSKVPPSYGRLVLMVIDGLPAEFVLGRGDKPPTKAMVEAMPYTQSLLSSGKARGYYAKAAPPTVTMPRLKAMVSGAIGGFLDVAFNFNTQVLLDDNLLDQFKRIGWELVMHGDETWIKLFPRIFTRQDGVSSFYVKDTVEVDFNVSRHLDVELAVEDWNLLILHYLGLDHVGHIGGRHSILMPAKLKEMDDVIKRIHMGSALHQQNPDASTLLVVVSDHGMTNGGNHGGSSYEETDSLALFIGSGVESLEFSMNAHKAAHQVDIAPTLALLFGVPIPKNNIGVLLRGMFDTLTDEQRLRALQLNSWQFLRLLQAHLPNFLCGDATCISGEDNLQTDQSISSMKENLCYLYSRAISAHNAWLLHQISSLTNLSTCFCLGKYCSQPKEISQVWQVEEAFVLIGLVIHALSLGASSMVEEEQYTWHFLTSTLYLLFLLTTIRSLFKTAASDLMKMKKPEENLTRHLAVSNDESSYTTNNRSSPWTKLQENHRIYHVLVVLIFGRILRGWHQGGVNWVHLPDISKLLVQAGSFSIKALQIFSLLNFMLVGSFAFSLARSRTHFVHIVRTSYFMSGCLVLLHIINSQTHNIGPTDSSATSVAQLFYICAGSAVLLTALVSPWIYPVNHEASSNTGKFNLSSHAKDTSSIAESGTSCLIKEMRSFYFQWGIRHCTYLIGTTCMVFWCLLQLLLQQPVNAIPMLVIFLQETASIIYFSSYGSLHKQWIEVVAMLFLGMAGHFGLGNSNSLATIDVAGAFIGISSHSTVLSGILMFIITHASPLLSFLSMLICISLKDMNELFPSDLRWSSTLQLLIGFPCLLPLVLNSIVLVAFTITLLLMRNHLFVWSVFSPKNLNVKDQMQN
ncbi:Type I phosphodiesterase / nucleotide pyrophosphatase [Musa troglodytarum]|uniref:Type I phosphodiesterase / nucleotide pyrophosphatase n=1 Tax=Musa troglodytarum TaxID=320322 RepID=A0A9E7GQS4_9LILI|nr:Type I phosphodiesterase / nucleotide pyrophosphatase [Musa troglodytarum]